MASYDWLNFTLPLRYQTFLKVYTVVCETGHLQLEIK